ncbi:MAG: UDP-N-acetylmuramate dehydrogenase [Deltaproteobacteria bacterium]|nr:UDP-N-acetylmuramate dehydrogenase [Deltaproteobacteria bacterium]
MRSVFSDGDRESLSATAQGAVRFDEPMSRHTTLRIGGTADAWFEPDSISDLTSILMWCAERSIPVSVVGSGSNLLVLDRGIRGLVVATRSLRRLDLLPPTSFVAEAGVSTGRLLKEATERGLGGVEFLGGVPGTIGGGLIMNAGTNLGDFKDVTASVTSLRISNGSLVTRAGHQCGFGYRHSSLPQNEIVVSATFELYPRPRGEIEQAVRDLKDRRAEREPKGFPNAGSIFKNPPGLFAGKLIEEAGLKGRRAGGAEVSPKHANWIVNVGDALAADVLHLVDVARQAVLEKFGVTLEMEVKVVGEP